MAEVTFILVVGKLGLFDIIRSVVRDRGSEVGG